MVLVLVLVNYNNPYENTIKYTDREEQHLSNKIL